MELSRYRLEGLVLVVKRPDWTRGDLRQCGSVGEEEAHQWGFLWWLVGLALSCISPRSSQDRLGPDWAEVRDAAKLGQKTLSGGICLAPSLQIVLVHQSQEMETPHRSERKSFQSLLVRSSSPGRCPSISWGSSSFLLALILAYGWFYLQLSMISVFDQGVFPGLPDQTPGVAVDLTSCQKVTCQGFPTIRRWRLEAAVTLIVSSESARMVVWFRLVGLGVWWSCDLSPALPF